MPDSFQYPSKKYTIIGGGIIGYIAAYHLLQRAILSGEPVRISIQEKNGMKDEGAIHDTTTMHIVPSLTIDEPTAVVPPAPELIAKLKKPFNTPGGIRVDEAGVNESNSAREFIHAVAMYGKDSVAHQKRFETILKLGRMSMESWQEMFDAADAELKEIMIKSNFNPCREPRKNGLPVLHDGYRIDLLYNMPNDSKGGSAALEKATNMCRDYERLGYRNCEILSPDEVVRRDPFLKGFCAQHSELNGDGKRVWKKTAAALWRPGGCIDTQVFLPLFHDYLTKAMGKYINQDGVEKNCFQVHRNRNVIGVSYEENRSLNKINGLRLFGRAHVKKDKHCYPQSNYIFCPGENVGTVYRAGLPEPEYARFGGTSLMLKIKLKPEEVERYRTFNHCMEVHQEGIVLAWQARCIDDTIFIGVAGTKAFYGDQEPKMGQKFETVQTEKQLEMVNDVLSEFLSKALGRNTFGEKLTKADLAELKRKGIATCWVGSRALAADGFPTVGKLGPNSAVITHAGSGGVSISHALVRTLFGMVKPEQEDLMRDTLDYGNPHRSHRTTTSKI